MKAVARWGWRIARRDWRQQVLVVLLLSTAVAGATFLAAVAYNATGDIDGRFGGANQRFDFDGHDPSATAADLALARRTFGAADLVEMWDERLAGSVDRIDVRRLDLDGPYASATVSLRDGRFPAGRDEIAVSAVLADQLGLSTGDELALDDETRTVVGIVENPAQLDDEFAFVTEGPSRPPDAVALLMVGSEAEVEAYRGQMTTTGDVSRMSRGSDQDDTTAVLLTFGMSTVAMLMVALIAAASFIVIGQRRLRYFGILAAVGASTRQLRTVTLVGGALVGAAAAVIGVGVGVGIWAGTEGWIETVEGHRIDGLHLPVWLLAISAALAVLTALAAAWWPARAVARVPVTSALAARPPRPPAAHRSALAGVVIGFAGVACLAFADQRRPWLIILGALATPIGVLLLAPLAIRAVGRVATRLPVTARLAVRDLARHQARSGAALAAISLALGIQVTVVIAATLSADAPDEGNLPSSQLVFHLGEEPEPFIAAERSAPDLDAIGERIDAFLSTLGDAVAAPLDFAVDPNPPQLPDGVPPGKKMSIVLGRVEGPDSYSGQLLFVATPELLELVGAGNVASDSHDFYVTQPGDYVLLKADRQEPEHVTVQRIDGSGFQALPTAFAPATAVKARGWGLARAGWLVDAGRPLTSDERAAARRLATDTGMFVESRDNQAALGQVRTIATAIGMLLALGILAMTVGLIRGEAAPDLRTLTATGATSRARRSLTGVTAAVLAALGVVLGIAGSYIALTGALWSDLHELRSVPWTELLITALGVPLVAGIAGWLLSGRDPGAMTMRSA